MTIIPDSISVVIPVYNSENSLPVLLSRLEPVLKSLTSKYEVIFVNDGSTDNSWEKINEIVGLCPWTIGVDLMRNYGQHNALLCGVRIARNDIIVTMDDDLQHPPEEIPKLIAKLTDGFDVVYGTPEKEQHGFWRDRASQISKLILQESMGAEIARKASAFRAFRKELRGAFDNYQSSFVALDVLLTWGTTRFATVTVRHDTRLFGISNYTFSNLLKHALNMFTGFSTLPLQWFSLLGFVFVLLGLGVLIFVTGRYFIQGLMVHWLVFLASFIIIFSGLQLVALGIIGEYLARAHFRIMGKPPNVIRQVVGLKKVTIENNQ